MTSTPAPIVLALALLAVRLGAAEPGFHVYVGTYTDGDSKGIYRFSFDDETGQLLPQGLAAETASPSFLVADPRGRLLLAVNENDKVAPGSGGVSSFAVDARSGALTFLNQQPSGGAWPCHLALHPTGRYVFVANYGGSATVLPVSPDGRLSPLVSRVDPQGQGPTPRQKGSHAHGVYLDATSTKLLVPDLGLDQVLVFAIDPATGRLSPATPPSAALAPGSGPRHLAWSADGRFLHSVNELDSTVTTFAWDGRSGRLESRGVVKTLPDDFKGESYTAEIAVHPNGRFVYASNRGHDSLAVFAADGSGNLRRTAVVPVGGKKPRHFALSPSGRFLLAAHQESDTIAVFKVDAETGGLTLVGNPVAAPRPVCLLFLRR